MGPLFKQSGREALRQLTVGDRGGRIFKGKGMSGLVKDVNSKEELQDLLPDQHPAILHFSASTCETSRQMDQVFRHLSSDFPYANFIRVDLFRSLSLNHCDFHEILS